MKMTANAAIGLALAAGLALGANTGFAQQVKCPDSPNRVIPTVEASVKFDAATNLYTYRYTVRNGAQSAQAIDSFAVDFRGSTLAVANPTGWTHGLFSGRNTLGWDATLADDTAPVGTVVPPSIAQIEPGDSLGGFSFQSPQGPGAVKFYVTGFAPVGPLPTEADAERIEENCPQLARNILDQAVIGLTQGPSDAIAIVIDIKPGSDPNAINPRNQGVVPVAILGSTNFDVASVDQKSVRLGPGAATPLNGKGHIEDANKDGFPDLMFQFPTQDTGVQCFDGALVVSGRTVDGKPILGVDAIVTRGCQ